MYEIKKEVKTKLAEEMMEELEGRYYPYNVDVIYKIIDKWAERKSPLIDLLSRHPNWNPEKLMIQFDNDYSREFNRKALLFFANWLERAILKERQLLKVDYDILYFIRYQIGSQFFNPEMDVYIEEINDLNDNFKLRNNMKSSKAILKLCKEMGYDKLPHTGELYNSTPERPKYNDFNYEYAMLCDNINPMKVTRHTCISLNPMDFLLMSNGNGWKSCHYIEYFGDEPGCYSSGTISYMLDECSFVFYTVDKSFNGMDIEEQPKLQRQIFGYQDEVFVQSRLYPQSMDCGAEAVYTDIRNIVQKVIADCLEKPNLWIKSKADVNDIVETGYGATCYPDWENGNPGATHCSISRLKGSTSRPKILLGAEPICIECGRTHDISSLITCCSDNERGETCYCCGDFVEEDDVYWVNDNPYCGDCVIYCDDCDDYEISNDAVEVYYINSYGNRCCKSVCRDCAKDYFQCECCGEVWDDDDMIYTEEGNYYCPDCSDEYDYCEKCGKYHDSDCMVYDEETCQYYCRDCYEELLEEREEEKEYEEAI